MRWRYLLRYTGWAFFLILLAFHLPSLFSGDEKKYADLSLNPQRSFRDQGGDTGGHKAAMYHDEWELGDGVSQEEDDGRAHARVLRDVNKCKDDVILAVFVHSRSSNVDRRSTLRATWGTLGLYDLGVRLIFVMGVMSSDESSEKVVAFESRRYDDIVQESFEDTYPNVTLKAMAGLRWVKRGCPKAKYVLKAEDNTFVNMPALLQHLWDLSQAKQDKKLLMGRIWWDVHTIREGSELYAVSKEQYPFDQYPPYCSGTAFTMSTDVALDILAAAPDVPFLKIADVYITGLIVHKINVQHIQFNHLYLNPDSIKLFGGETWYTCLFMDINDQDTFINTWDILMTSAKKYPIPKVPDVKLGQIAGSKVPESALKPHPLSAEFKTALDKFLET